jgi:hypothetical protein
MDIPQITIEQWPTMALPKEEIQAALQYLAFKARRPVTFRPYREGEGYSADSVSVRVGVSAGDAAPHMTNTVALEGKSYDLSLEQQGRTLPHIDDAWDCIEDEKGQTIGLVDHNRIIFPVEITASDNEAARAVLAYVIERAAALLDFDVSEVLKKREKELAQDLAGAVQAGGASRLREREQELQDKTHDAEQAYRTIVDFERQKPTLQEEIEFLTRLAERPNSQLARTQARALLQLQASGLYTRVLTTLGGGIVAETSPITIEHDGYSFPVGRYEVELPADGEVTIKALDPHPRASYPHPHVAGDGRPCLGSASGDVARLIGRLRLAEALQLLHAFLSSYNGENPFERIGRFDPDGAYSDESEDPCEDCDEKCSAFCVCSCDNNDGAYSCEDCYDARTDSCYRECSRNEDYAQFHPCDGCSRRGSNDCYLECQYNEEWELQDPCEDCDEKCSAYCICSCGDNDGAYSCEDCYDARTDSCYRECSRNEDYAQYHPCDGCSRHGSDHCYLACQYNEEWELQDPCDECEEEDCVEADCSYLQKRKELGYDQRTEGRQAAPAAAPNAEAAARR